jgi:hypothetical protein
MAEPLEQGEKRRDICSRAFDEERSDMHRDTLQKALQDYESALKAGNKDSARLSKSMLIQKIGGVHTQSPGIGMQYYRELIEFEAKYLRKEKISIDNFFDSVGIVVNAGYKLHARRCLERNLAELDQDAENYNRLMNRMPEVIVKVRALGFGDLADKMTERYRR